MTDEQYFASIIEAIRSTERRRTLREVLEYVDEEGLCTPEIIRVIREHFMEAEK